MYLRFVPNVNRCTFYYALHAVLVILEHVAALEHWSTWPDYDRTNVFRLNKT